MKKVVSESTVSHLWAHQTQTEARNARNTFYFHGDTIYSYGGHFPIAIHYKDKVLFTTRTYSNTTAGHKYAVKSVVSHKDIIYCLNVKDAKGGDHGANLQDFNNEAKNIAFKLATARKPEIYLNQILEQKKLFETYIEFFKIKVNGPKKYPYLFIVSKDGSQKATEKERKAIAAANKKREAERKILLDRNLKEDKEKIENWRTFETYYGHLTTLYLTVLKGTYLRFNAEKQTIETSKGISIPVKVAARIYKQYTKILNSGGCDGDCDIKILDYRVNSINAAGLVVGCHNIEVSEIEAIKQYLN